MTRKFFRSVLIGVSLVTLIYLLIKRRNDGNAWAPPSGESEEDGEGSGGVNPGENSRRLNAVKCSVTTCPQYADPYSWNFNWDGLKETRPLPDRCLILIRHGQYTFGSGRLTDVGKKQAELTGRRLAEMNYTINSIVHSTMDRAVETALLLQQQLQQQQRRPNVQLLSDSILMEGGPIPPDPEIKYWSLPAKDYLVNGPRLEAAFKKYFHRPREATPPRTCTILVGHGNIFRSFILRSLQLPVFAWMRMFIAHASISLIYLRSDGTNSVQLIGDAGHLPYPYVTY